MVDHAGALGRRLAVEVEMQQRLRRVAVQPGAVEAEVGPRADAQAEQADVEVERLAVASSAMTVKWFMPTIIAASSW